MPRRTTKPPPEPPSPAALRRWTIHKAANRLIWVAEVEALDEAAPIEKAAEELRLPATKLDRDKARVKASGATRRLPFDWLTAELPPRRGEGPAGWLPGAAGLAERPYAQPLHFLVPCFERLLRVFQAFSYAVVWWKRRGTGLW